MYLKKRGGEKERFQGHAEAGIREYNDLKRHLKTIADLAFRRHFLFNIVTKTADIQTHSTLGLGLGLADHHSNKTQ